MRSAEQFRLSAPSTDNMKLQLTSLAPADITRQVDDLQMFHLNSQAHPALTMCQSEQSIPDNATWGMLCCERDITKFSKPFNTNSDACTAYFA